MCYKSTLIMNWLLYMKVHLCKVCEVREGNNKMYLRCAFADHSSFTVCPNIYISLESDRASCCSLLIEWPA